MPLIFPWYLIWGFPYALARHRILGGLLVAFPFAAALVLPEFTRVWTLLLVFPMIVIMAYRTPTACTASTAIFEKVALLRTPEASPRRDSHAHAVSRYAGRRGHRSPQALQKHGGYVLAAAIDKYMYVGLQRAGRRPAGAAPYTQSETVERSADLRHGSPAKRFCATASTTKSRSLR